MNKFVLSLLFSLILTPAFAQYYIVTGRIYDKADKLVLPNAHIIVLGSDGNPASASIADLDGNYKVALDKTEVTLLFKYIGYAEVTKRLTFTKRNEVIELDVALSQDTRILQEAVITQQRYYTDKKLSAQTLDVIGIKQIERENAVTLDRALVSVPGLTIVDNEPQMRGGSGFSSGMGSRVMILLNEMPILRADAGRPAWNLIPMEDVAQIEILKGASSVMYGSAAINGAINVRSQYAKNEPLTKINVYGGVYSKPADRSKSPYANEMPVKFGVSASHSRKIKKVDLSMGAEYMDDEGYRGDTLRLFNPVAGETRGDKEHRVKAERRFRANIETTYRLNHRVSISLGMNYMFSDNNQSHFWYNAKESIYNTYPGTLSHFNDQMFFFDPQVKYTDPNGGQHSWKNRILFSDNKVLNIKAQDAASTTTYNTYNYKKVLNSDLNWQLNAGVSNQYAHSVGTVFSGNPEDIGAIGTHFANNAAIFARTEIDFLTQRNLNISLGARWEFCNIDNFSENRPIFQLGANYFIPASHTYFRGNIGQGYRAATIGERYITTRIGKYGFYPNPNLQSETSVNAEIGVKQMFRLGGFEGFIDASAFYQVYDNYIEFCMGPFRPIYPNEPPPLANDMYGFKFFNTGPAEIKGVEANIAGEGVIGPHIGYQVNLAYTYALPQSLNPDYIYATVANKGYTLANSSSDHKNPALLKYRIQHVGKADLNLTFIKRFTLGISAKYTSAMEKMDQVFYVLDAPGLPFHGMQDYYDRTINGAWVFDVRGSVDLSKFTISLICNNLLNTEYSLRPMHVEAPRQLMVAVMYKFNDINPGLFFWKNKYKPQ